MTTALQNLRSRRRVRSRRRGVRSRRRGHGRTRGDGRTRRLRRHHLLRAPLRPHSCTWIVFSCTWIVIFLSSALGQIFARRPGRGPASERPKARESPCECGRACVAFVASSGLHAYVASSELHCAAVYVPRWIPRWLSFDDGARLEGCETSWRAPFSFAPSLQSCLSCRVK